MKNKLIKLVIIIVSLVLLVSISFGLYEQSQIIKPYTAEVNGTVITVKNELGEPISEGTVSVRAENDGGKTQTVATGEIDANGSFDFAEYQDSNPNSLQISPGDNAQIEYTFEDGAYTVEPISVSGRGSFIDGYFALKVVSIVLVIWTALLGLREIAIKTKKRSERKANLEAKLQLKNK